MLVIAAALTVQDPRERPQERQGTADAAHEKFADEKSEFLPWLKLWNWLRGRGRAQEIAAQAGAGGVTKTSSPRCACASGWTSIASCTGWPPSTMEGEPIPATYEAIHRRPARRPARQYRLQVRGFSVLPRRARHEKFLVHPGLRRWSRRPENGSPRPRSLRRLGSLPAASRASSRSGWR